jgi:hypothetical protein
VYGHPGTYSEILKVTDRQGRSAYDLKISFENPEALKEVLEWKMGEMAKLRGVRFKALNYRIEEVSIFNDIFLNILWVPYRRCRTEGHCRDRQREDCSIGPPGNREPGGF